MMSIAEYKTAKISLEAAKISFQTEGIICSLANDAYDSFAVWNVQLAFTTQVWGIGLIFYFNLRDI